MSKAGASKSGRRQRVTIGLSLLGLAAFLAIGGLVGPDLPDAQSGQVNLLLVLVIGLTAGGLSCLAVQGGLLCPAHLDVNRVKRPALAS